MGGRRFALQLVLGFCASLLLGWCVFRAEPVVRSSASGAAKAASDPSAASAQVQATPASEPAAVLSDEQLKRKAGWEEMLKRDGIKRQIEMTAQGAKNKNQRMETTFAVDYAGGVEHRNVMWRNDDMVRWVPGGTTLQRGGEVVKKISDVEAGRGGKIVKGKAGDTYLYDGAPAGIQERYQITGQGGVEHFWTLDKKPEGAEQAESLVFSGRLELGPQLYLYDGQKRIEAGKAHSTTGKLLIRNPAGQAVFDLSEAVAYDKKVTTTDGSYSAQLAKDPEGRMVACRYEVCVSADGHVADLSVAVPATWLNDPKRAYPVVVDPNLGPGGLSDAIFNNGSPIYTGSAASGGGSTLINLHTGATDYAGQSPLPAGIGFRIRDNQFTRCGAKPDNGFVVVGLPFTFVFYGVPFNIAVVHIDGYINFPLPPCPIINPCGDHFNTNIPNPTLPNNCIFAYWDDLKFSGDPQSGVYVAVTGIPGNRVFVVEWYKMAFVGGNGAARISFNAVLRECDNSIEIIIGDDSDPTESDPGLASVGIENCSGAIGIQFDFDSSLGTPLNRNGIDDDSDGQVDEADEGGLLEPIVPGTSVGFRPTVAANLSVIVDDQVVTAGGQVSNPDNCAIPVNSCFQALLTIPDLDCGNNPSPIVPAFGFEWTFFLPDTTGGSVTPLLKFFTKDFCHRFATPGAYTVFLQVKDSTGLASSFGPFTYLVCDFPRIFLAASPQGGTAPLEVQFSTDSQSTTIAYQGADDFNTVPVGTFVGDRFFVVVDPGNPADGENGLLETLPLGDDEIVDLGGGRRVIVAGPNQINDTPATNGQQLVVAPGVDTNGDGFGDTLVTTPDPDDRLVGVAIVAGPNNVADTTAVPPDIQVLAPGTLTSGTNTPAWIIEKLIEEQLQSKPSFVAMLPSGNKTPSFIFTQAGIYKVTVIYTGIDIATNLPTQNRYSIFIFVEEPNAVVDDNMLIESSSFTIPWAGKLDSDDPDLLDDDPFKDTITIAGRFNLPNFPPSGLGAVRMAIHVALNGTLQLFEPGDGFLDDRGNLTVNELPEKGGFRSFTLNLPSGQFRIVAKNQRLDGALGCFNFDEFRLLPVHIRIELLDLTDPFNPVRIYPTPEDATLPPDQRGAIISYDYRSLRGGNASGQYKFGRSTIDGIFTVSPGPGTVLSVPTGGQTLLVSSAFIVTKAKMNLKGAYVTADIRGRLARFGADDLRPQPSSDVTVQIGPAFGPGLLPTESGFSETLNFITDPVWTVKGKKGAADVFTFKRNTNLLNKTGIQSLSWASRAGDFRIKTYPIANLDFGLLEGGVGLDPVLTTQVCPVRLYISHENDTVTGFQNFDGQTEVLLFKTGTTTFKK
ncbi:MAG: hypothetical protein L6R28_15065 [Planctomycetes bacterium]|nr:hypothetical protein [Planctomycetota bacterium]